MVQPTLGIQIVPGIIQDQEHMTIHQKEVCLDTNRRICDMMGPPIGCLSNKKIESYRAVNRWSDSECRDYLNWCLEGKALDYFTIETSMGEWLSYTDIMLKMERRFGTKELLELSKVKFHQAIQGQQESLEEWADRVLTLATPAF